MMEEKIRKSGPPEAVSVQYGIPLGSLANMRSQRRGPKFYRRGRKIIYFFEDIEKWLKSQPGETF